MRNKHQSIEEPCEGKLSRTVLKTSGTGDSLAEFNAAQAAGIRFQQAQSWRHIYGDTNVNLEVGERDSASFE